MNRIFEYYHERGIAMQRVSYCDCEPGLGDHAAEAWERMTGGGARVIDFSLVAYIHGALPRKQAHLHENYHGPRIRLTRPAAWTEVGRGTTEVE